MEHLLHKPLTVTYGLMCSGGRARCVLDVISGGAAGLNMYTGYTSTHVALAGAVEFIAASLRGRLNVRYSRVEGANQM